MRSAFHRLTNRMMGSCRVCGSSSDVICYDPRGLWAFSWRTTYCPAHCPDHDFSYQRDIRGWACDICGEPAPPDYGVD